MRFEPRLIRDDGQVDTANQLDADLPDDLAMLAGQLADDASFLAEQYPPSHATHRRIVRTARWRAVGRRLVSPNAGIAAAAVLVACITAGVTFALWQGNAETTASPAAGVGEVESPTSQNARAAVANGILPDPSSIASHSSPSADFLGVVRPEPGGPLSGAGSTEHVRSMTGAELEGWIDLMDRNKLSQQPLSF